MSNELKVAMKAAQFEMMRLYTFERNEKMTKWLSNDSQYPE
jgi:hypothetical protein